MSEILICPDMLWSAYRQGAFPMTDDDGAVRFYVPGARAIFPDCEMRVSRSLSKLIRQGDFEISYDGDFSGVVRGCFREEDNWLSDQLLHAYVGAFLAGFAHSCEVYRAGHLVGGIFGVAIGGCFSADSMFHRESNMSKIALFYMLKKVKSLGFSLFDAQIVNSHTASLGCVEVDLQQYVYMRESAMTTGALWG